MGETVEYEFTDLKETYENFFRPACSVLAGEQNLTVDLKCKIHSLTVRLCLGQPSEAEIELSDCYSFETHTMKESLISGLLPGTGIQISLGYGSQLSQVFCGYIDCLEAEISERAGYMLRVKAADVCKLMRDCGKRRRVLQAEKHSEAFTEVMKGYEGFCEAEAEETSYELTQGLFQTESDFDFVTERLLKETGGGFEFLVEKGTAYFRECKSDRKPLLALAPGKGVQTLQLGISYVNRELEIHGYSAEQGLLTASKTAAASHVDSNASTGKEILTAPWLTAQEAVNEAATAYEGYLLGQARQGTVTMVGLPILLPGNYVLFQEIGPRLNGAYYMSKVEHTLGDKGYSTTIQI